MNEAGDSKNGLMKEREMLRFPRDDQRTHDFLCKAVGSLIRRSELDDECRVSGLAGGGEDKKLVVNRFSE